MEFPTKTPVTPYKTSGKLKVEHRIVSFWVKTSASFESLELPVKRSSPRANS